MIQSANIDAGELAMGDVAMDIEDLRDLMEIIHSSTSRRNPSVRDRELIDQADAVLETHYGE